MKKPYIPFWITDYRNDKKVKLMDFETRGFYLEMIFECWLWGGSLPADINKLSTIMNTNTRTCKRLLAKCRSKWQLSDGSLVNSRVTEELLKLNEKSKKAQEAALIRHYGDANASPKQPNLGCHSDSDSETEFKISVNSETIRDKSSEPENKKSEKSKSGEYSKKTQLLISRAINGHSEAFSSQTMVDSPRIKRLILDLLEVPQIDTEMQRLLAYVIQAKTAEKPKNVDERVAYSIKILKSAKYAPSDSAMQSAKEVINNWNSGFEAQSQVDQIMKDKGLK